METLRSTLLTCVMHCAPCRPATGWRRLASTTSSMYIQYLETKCMCMSCDVCVILLVLQILDKVSPNPAEAKAVTARKNRKKNRFDQFLPGMYHLHHSSASCNAETHIYSHSLFQLTDGSPTRERKPGLYLRLLQSMSVNTLLHISEESIDIRSILLSYMSVSIV